MNRRPVKPPPLAASAALPRVRAESLGALLRAAWREYERDRAGYLAVAMVYYALISLAPILLLLLSMLGLLLRFSAGAAQVEQQLLARVESSFGTELRATIEAAFVSLQEESIVTSIISAAVLLLTASVLFRHLRLTFRAIWKHEPPLVAVRLRTAVWATLVERVIAFAMVFGGGALFVAALLLIGVSHWLYRTLGGVPLLGYAVNWMLPAAASLLLLTATVAALFKFLPPVSISWRDVWLPALLCAAAWFAAGELLTLYGVFFGSSRSASGAFGGLLAIMLWMNAVGKILFFGAELCKVSATRER